MSSKKQKKQKQKQTTSPLGLVESIRGLPAKTATKTASLVKPEKMTREQRMAERQRLGKLRGIDRDLDLTSDLDLCDPTYPIIGHICGKLNYRNKGIMDWIWMAICIFLLINVIIVDVILDIFFVIWDVGSNFITAIPIIGPIIDAVESLEIDDWLDAINTGIIFICCGPIAGAAGAALALVFEVPEGPLELLPTQAVMILIWLLYIRPAKRRVEDYKEQGIVNKYAEIHVEKIE